ncbi:MAG: septation regulator SpoVG [Firmicutes bacterium]|nr:septation regulator SpoVG [Bacillota bacterium]
MNITDIRIRKVGDESKLKAVASITFDGEFVVHDIKVIEGQNGLFIAMPSKKMGEGDYRDIAHPLTQEVRTRLRDAVLEAYNKEILENE